MCQFILCVVAASLQPDAESIMPTNLHTNKGTYICVNVTCIVILIFYMNCSKIKIKLFSYRYLNCLKDMHCTLRSAIFEKNAFNGVNNNVH